MTSTVTSNIHICYHHFMDNEVTPTKNHKFLCPNCGEISRDDVIFLCNHCEKDDQIFQDGIYMCPSCLMPGENFQCMLCDSKQVKLVNQEPVEESSK